MNKNYYLVCEASRIEKDVYTFAGGTLSGLVAGNITGRAMANKRYNQEVDNLENEIKTAKGANKNVLLLRYSKLTDNNGKEFKNKMIKKYTNRGGFIGAGLGGATIIGRTGNQMRDAYNQMRHS